MPIEQPTNVNAGDSGLSEAALTLKQFLLDWDESYTFTVRQLPIFDVNITGKWTKRQCARFVKMFYHVRGHFVDFLWLLGNHAPSKAAKQQVLYNIEEEFGGDNHSHEQLFFQFARSLGLDLHGEVISQAHYLPFIRDFNEGHLQWLHQVSWAGKWAAFSAYERLDNIEYENLYQLARSLGVQEQDLIFFIIHKKADHFDRTYEALVDVWRTDQLMVRQAFDFIAQHQITMWRQFSLLMLETE